MSTVETAKSAPFDASEYLDSEEMIAAYLNAALEEDDQDVLLAVLSDVIFVRGEFAYLKEPLAAQATDYAFGSDHPLFGGRGLHGRWNQRRPGAPLGLVGLGDDGGDVESLAEQRPEGRHRELRGAEEHDTHGQALVAVSGTSRSRPVCPFRSVFHLRSMSRRLSGLSRSRKRMPSR